MRTGAGADGDRGHRADETGSGRNRYQTGNRAGSSADDAGLAAGHPAQGHPDDSAVAAARWVTTKALLAEEPSRRPSRERYRR